MLKYLNLLRLCIALFPVKFYNLIWWSFDYIPVRYKILFCSGFSRAKINCGTRCQDKKMNYSNPTNFQLMDLSTIALPTPLIFDTFLTCSLYTNPDICICCRSTWRTGQDGAAVVCREVWFAHTHLSLDVGLEARVAHLLEARVALLHLCLDVNASSCHQHWHFSVSLGSSRMWGKEYKVCTIAHVRFSLLIILSLNSEWWLCPISWVTSPSRYQSATSVSSWDPGLSSGGHWHWWGTSFQIISSAHTRSFKWGTMMGDKLSDIFILLLYQVFQIGDAQPPQKAHIGAQVFQTSLLV